MKMTFDLLHQRNLNQKVCVLSCDYGLSKNMYQEIGGGGEGGRGIAGRGEREWERVWLVEKKREMKRERERKTERERAREQYLQLN